MSPDLTAAPHVGWQARLDLAIARLDAGSGAAASRVVRRRHEGPTCIQRAFYPEGNDIAHVYVLHPPGGLVGGDQLELTVRVESGASALVTTPAAQKLYRSQGAFCQQLARLGVDPEASLEWLPGENIAFRGARARLETRVDVASGGAFVGWEITCLGRPASDEIFTDGRLLTTLRLERDGQPLLLERMDIDANETLRTAPWGLGGSSVWGTLVAVPRGPTMPLAPLADRLRNELDSFSGARWAVTALESLLVVRVLESSTERARALLIAAWQAIRHDLTGRAPSVPRIWKT